jgi:hypothetical protein
MEKPIDIKEKMAMSYALWEKHKETWAPMRAEHGKTFILFMIEEIGEAIAIIKKKGETEIMENTEVRHQFIEEMCDVMMYYSDVLNRFGVTPEEYSKIYRSKFTANMERDFEMDHANS